MKLRLKNILKVTYDFILVIAGMLLVPFGAFNWQKTGFNFKLSGEMGGREGNEALYFLILGIFLIVYGLSDFFFFKIRRDK
jgi:uncharacterized membrane protein